MFYVYLLQEVVSRKVYIGYTSDLRRRVKEHQTGIACQTTKTGQWRLIYYEAFLAKEDAVMRERKLKHHGSAKNKLLARLDKSLAGQNRAGRAQWSGSGDCLPKTQFSAKSKRW
jgi:putative endonuclease